MYPDVRGGVVPPGTVTIRSTAPAAWVGVLAVMTVPFTKATSVAGAPPKVTEVTGLAKLPPEIVTWVPPAVGPELGVTLERKGLPSGACARVGIDPKRIGIARTRMAHRL
jgi:hypothetical protein